MRRKQCTLQHSVEKALTAVNALQRPRFINTGVQAGVTMRNKQAV
jgi:hypothetical protein